MENTSSLDTKRKMRRALQTDIKFLVKKIQFMKNTFFSKSLKRNSQQPKGKVGETGCDIPGEEIPIREATEALRKNVEKKSKICERR